MGAATESAGARQPFMVGLRVTGSSFELFRCGELVFAGEGMSTGTDITVTGEFSGQTPPIPAVLRLQLDAALPATSTVTATLTTDGFSTPVLGPVMLERSASVDPNANCP
jgi:hypothetical protein